MRPFGIFILNNVSYIQLKIKDEFLPCPIVSNYFIFQINWNYYNFMLYYR